MSAYWFIIFWASVDEQEDHSKYFDHHFSLWCELIDYCKYFEHHSIAVDGILDHSKYFDHVNTSEEQNFDLAKLIFIRVWYVHADPINFI